MTSTTFPDILLLGHYYITMNDFDRVPDASFPDGADASASPVMPARISYPATMPTPGNPLLGTQPFRPRLRRHMAIVHVIDDGREGGEVIRMRGDRLLIGRTEGDVVLPHDICMAPAHAVIERVDAGGWLLRDLRSPNGTFVRVTSARLATGTVIQIGRTRLLFEEASPTSGRLIERPAGGGAGRQHECRAPGATIGRAGGGPNIALADPMVSPIHAAIHCTAQGWRIANSGLNGLWVRINKPVRMVAVSQFLCGEQRFVFEPLT